MGPKIKKAQSPNYASSFLSKESNTHKKLITIITAN